MQRSLVLFWPIKMQGCNWNNWSSPVRKQQSWDQFNKTFTSVIYKCSCCFRVLSQGPMISYSAPRGERGGSLRGPSRGDPGNEVNCSPGPSLTKSFGSGVPSEFVSDCLSFLLRHQNALTEKAQEDAIQGQGNGWLHRPLSHYFTSC